MLEVKEVVQVVCQECQGWVECHQEWVLVVAQVVQVVHDQAQSQ